MKGIKKIVRGIRQQKERGLFYQSEMQWQSFSLVFITVIAFLGILFALQGWKARKPAQDMLIYIQNAKAFLHEGALPQYGDISSYGSYSPPGTSWLLIPGILAFDDPRLYEKIGSLGLHLGTLAGIYLLTQAVFGRGAAYISIILYGLSGIGLSFSGSLWPIGHPFFYVWMAYFACLWAARQESRYFTAALLIWGVGMYLDMALTPAFFLFPAIWFIYRPAVFGRSLILGGVLLFGLWYPYLQFESERDYIDIHSQLLRRYIVPDDYRNAWCDPGLIMSEVDRVESQVNPISEPALVLMNGMTLIDDRVIGRITAIQDGLLSNFLENTHSFTLSLALLIVVLSGAAVVGITGIFFRWEKQILGNGHESEGAVTPAHRFKSIMSNKIRDERMGAALVLSLLAPWFILLVVVEPGRTERFLWLWPLQAILLSAFAVNLLPTGRFFRKTRWIAPAVLILAIVPAALLPITKQWFQTGWAGKDAEEVQIAGYMAKSIQSKGKDRAAIGYHLYIYPFMANYHALAPQYKVGAEIDLLLSEMHGISNTDQCAEGLSPEDEYRIRQTRLEQMEGAPTHFFEMAMDDDFHLVQEFENYQVLERR